MDSVSNASFDETFRKGGVMERPEDKHGSQF
jgi:hypothetical protein